MKKDVKNNYDLIRNALSRIYRLERYIRRNIDPMFGLREQEEYNKAQNSNPYGTTAQEGLDNITNALGGWVNLDKTSPISVVLDMSKYEIQIKLSTGEWVDTEIKDELELMSKLVVGLTEYRYRIIPKEKIKVTSVVMQPDGNMRCKKENGDIMILVTDDDFNRGTLDD